MGVDRRLRILFVDTERVWRGGQEQLLSLVAGLKQRGHEVCLAAPSGAPLSARAAAAGIPCQNFRQRSEFSPLALLNLWRQLSQRRVDIVYFNTPRAILAGGLSAWLSGTPSRVCSRRVNFPLNNHLSRFKYNWLLERIVTVSESIRQTLIEDGVRPELVRVVYEGVDLDWIDGLRSPGLPVPRRGLVVGMVAHLSAEKGHRTLLEAASRVAGRFPDTQYFLVGDGALRDELLDYTRQLGLGDQVHFTGFRNDSDALMKEFDVFCLPSLSEGLSSAILSAMANRLPVIATQVGGIPELVQDGETGILTPPGESLPLSEALSRMLESESLRMSYGLAGRRRIEREFTLSLKLDQSERLLQDLLDGANFRYD